VSPTRSESWRRWSSRADFDAARSHAPVIVFLSTGIF
jgi:hypothetical protein